MCSGRGDGVGRLLLGATAVQERDLSPTQTRAQVAQGGHGVSMCGDIQNICPVPREASDDILSRAGLSPECLGFSQNWVV